VRSHTVVSKINRCPRHLLLLLLLLKHGQLHLP
jgi:hypothetical protein